MLSSDKNVETITQLGEVLKHYLGLQKEYVKLDVMDKVVRLLTAAALAIVFFLLVIAVMLFVSLAVAHWLSAYMALPLAYLVVAVFHVLVLLLVFVKRKPWIERPLTCCRPTLRVARMSCRVSCRLTAAVRQRCGTACSSSART